MNHRVSTLLDGRRERLERVLGRSMEAPEGTDDPPLTEEKRSYLLDEARNLYWNELEWENLTEEERLDEGDPLTELAFPGLLAYVRGLLLQEAMPDALAPAHPRPGVVEELLRFLAGRVVDLGDEAEDEDDDVRGQRIELAMTDRLIDLILYELYGLDDAEVEQVEAAARPS